MTEVKTVSKLSKQVIAEVERAIVGKHDLLEMVMAATLVGGHVLLEDYPGLGKTLIARSFATVLGLDFKRIQFTPDLLPGDITGGYIYNRVNNTFELRKGPLFANIILADEINRASPKTQSALLEAMQEGQVTLEGESMRLPEPFLALATQNPIEYEGTYPLPEAQKDRFMLKIEADFPGREDEITIATLSLGSHPPEILVDSGEIQPVLPAERLGELRRAIGQVVMRDELIAYAVDVVRQSRLTESILVAAGPRAAQSLVLGSRALAALRGRDFVTPDDIKEMARPVLAHRLSLRPEFDLEGLTVLDVITSLLEEVSVPQ